MEYNWKFKDNFKGFKKNYFVYVHFWHKGHILFQDDHLPPTPIQAWRKAKEVRYKRRIFIPQFIDEFDPPFILDNLDYR